MLPTYLRSLPDQLVTSSSSKGVPSIRSLRASIRHTKASAMKSLVHKPHTAASLGYIPDVHCTRASTGLLCNNAIVLYFM
jgi:hypothetical protein